MSSKSDGDNQSKEPEAQSKSESPEQGKPIRFEVRATELSSDGSPDFAGVIAALRKEARRLTVKVVEDDDLEEEELPPDAARLLELADSVERFAQEHGYI